MLRIMNTAPLLTALSAGLHLAAHRAARRATRAMRAVLAAAGLAAATLAQASSVVASINGDGAPPFLAFANSNIGWVYTPAYSHTLDGHFSTFRNVGSPTQQGPVASRTVTFEVRENNASGALLARGSFVADGAGGDLGGRFPPVLLVAGRNYFVSYDNVYNIGLNIPNWMPSQAPGTVNLEGWYTGQNYSSYFPKVIDGVLQVFSAPILRMEGNRVNSLASADCLFDWAQTRYATLFAPAAGAAMPTSQVYQTYYYRYYAGTRSYVGVSATDNAVYYIGPDGALTNVGPLAGWLLTAGCPATS